MDHIILFKFCLKVELEPGKLNICMSKKVKKNGLIRHLYIKHLISLNHNLKQKLLNNNKVNKDNQAKLHLKNNDSKIKNKLTLSKLCNIQLIINILVIN